MADEVGWRRNWKPDFSSAVWRPLEVNDKPVPLKIHFDKDLCSYITCLFDGVHLWYEEIDRDVFKKKCQVSQLS